MQSLEQNLLEYCHMYIFAMKNMFHKIPVELPKPSNPNRKHKSLLYAIGGGWYTKKIKSESSTPKEKEHKKKKHKKGNMK